MPELKTVLPNVRLRCASARQADFVIEGHVDPTEPLRHEGRPPGMLDHATSRIAGCKLGIDATKKLPGEGFKRPWPPLIKMDENVKAKVEKLLGKGI